MWSNQHMTDLPVITPDWPAPANVRALSTTRLGGVSTGAYAELNLGDHVGDSPSAVATNRHRVVSRLGLPGMPVWLRQVHGVAVAELSSAPPRPEADAAWTNCKGQVCAILTADCLPVLFCDRAGTVVAAAHAGWRGLSAGVLASCLRRMRVPADQVIAWLGPAISQQAFEVGAEVRAAFVQEDAGAAECFLTSTTGEGKYQADLYGLARRQLQGLGVTAVYGGDYCTYGDSGRFFSYRRDGVCGRMASLVWLTGMA
jgi:polyphenol oxidase